MGSSLAHAALSLYGNKHALSTLLLFCAALTALPFAFPAATHRLRILAGVLPPGTPLVPFDRWIQGKFEDAQPWRPTCNASSDIYSGGWVYDTSFPLWDPRECSVVTKFITCEDPGREDYGRKRFAFRNFRWQPRDCNLDR